MHLIDTHCHLDAAAFDSDRERVIAAARAAGVAAIVVPGIHAAAWPGLLSLCDREPSLYPALGLHPMFLDLHRENDLSTLADSAARARPVAIGEIGLDFHRPDADRARQTALLQAQLDLAARLRLPVLLHVRKAHDQVLQLLRRSGVPGGIAHAFSGSLQQAGKYIDLGFKLGFGGMLTFERSRRLHALARALPLEAIVLETDAPDLTVAAHRGERNSPEYLPDVLAVLARLRGTDPEPTAEQTSRNARELLGLAPKTP
jgi:TatD DNase family protein